MRSESHLSRTEDMLARLPPVYETRSSIVRLGLRIQGLPLPGHHLELARHVSYVCDAAVDCIQLTIPECEEDNLEELGELIATAVVGHLTEKPHVENR